MTDSFFSRNNCERCQQSIEGKGRTCSWFTDECICMDCSKKESTIKRKLRDKGMHDHEGCGYIPSVV